MVSGTCKQREEIRNKFNAAVAVKSAQLWNKVELDLIFGGKTEEEILEDVLVKLSKL